MTQPTRSIAARTSKIILLLLLAATVFGVFHIYALSSQLHAAVNAHHAFAENQPAQGEARQRLQFEGQPAQSQQVLDLADQLQQRARWLSLGLAGLGLWLGGLALTAYLRGGRISPAAIVGASDSDITLNALPGAVIRFSLDGRLRQLNPAAERLLGISQAEATGRRLSETLKLIEHDSRQSITPTLLAELKQGNLAGLGEQACLITQEGLELEVEGQAAPILSASGQTREAVLAIRDVTEAREQGRKQTWLAEHDALTGALNRKAFEERLAKSINSKRASEYPMTLLVVGVDSHTAVLQREGTPAANELLIQIARLIQTRVRDTDLVGRLDDTQFGVLLPACPDEIAQRIARTLHESLGHHKLLWGKADYLVNTSLGVVHIPRNWETLDRVMTAGMAACAQSRASRDIAIHAN
ncbi:MAG: diguanylate cyclase [Hydrogenophilaceae bacterium]|nr:diguanylate cyclase [Hydrogenophilaceae bacterium]